MSPPYGKSSSDPSLPMNRRHEEHENREAVDAVKVMHAALKMLREIDDAYGFDLDEPQRDQMHDAIALADLILAEQREVKS